MEHHASKETGPMSPTKKGFTLIELLVVIAIIAILAAILFPTFFGVREKARQGTVMDSFRQINTALARYKLDQHHYPPVLFGYAVAGKSMTQQDSATGGLYPLYINNATVFTDPNNNAATPDQQQPWSGKALDATGALSPLMPSQNVYTADAFDANPLIKPDGTLDKTTSVVRYQLAWTSFPPTPADANSTRQLANPNPPADTFVTCTTYHAGPGISQGKVMVLFVDGHASTMDDKKFLAAAGTDGPNSPFWHVEP